MTDLRSRVVVITGASSGIGAAAARKAHARGARVIVVGRNPGRTARAGADLGVPAVVGDYLDLASVRRLATHILDQTQAVDVLLANAGGAFGSRSPTTDGHEPNYQANALAPFLLEILLLPALLSSSSPRIVATTSNSHRGLALTPSQVRHQLADANGLGAHSRYARAKLVLLLLHAGLRCRHPGLEIVDVHPGIVASDFGRYLGGAGAALKVLARPVLSSPATAAEHLIRLAAVPELLGTYYHRQRPDRPSPLVADASLQREVWQVANVHLTRGKDQHA
jgi:NAD(P)-dependent dehydrogenase (short-subunit alcohol dehydrogenase family)